MLRARSLVLFLRGRTFRRRRSIRRMVRILLARCSLIQTSMRVPLVTMIKVIATPRISTRRGRRILIRTIFTPFVAWSSISLLSVLSTMCRPISRVVLIRRRRVLGIMAILVLMSWTTRPWSLSIRRSRRSLLLRLTFGLLIVPMTRFVRSRLRVRVLLLAYGRLRRRLAFLRLSPRRRLRTASLFFRRSFLLRSLTLMRWRPRSSNKLHTLTFCSHGGVPIPRLDPCTTQKKEAAVTLTIVV